MSERLFTIEKPDGGAVMKMWDSHHIDETGKHVGFEPAAMAQLRNTARLPFVYKHIAAMPDAHAAYGVTVGTVLATKGAIIPYAVGVDIGCGMMAIKTTARAEQLPDNLFEVRSAIEAAVPHGRTDGGGVNDRGAWGETPEWINDRFGVDGASGPIRDGLHEIVEKHPKLARSAKRSRHHLGTLGGGNHFIEVCIDEEGFVWIMLHSGSRGIGNAIGTYFVEKAKEEMARYFISNLSDPNLAYLVEKTEVYDDYIQAVGWAQAFAMENRQIMMLSVIEALGKLVGLGKFPPFDLTEMAVNCHHNYVEMEHHFGQNVLVTRKGAVRARAGDLGIIPGSMGARSYIVRGLGNPDSFHSCSHGAGRVMSRGKAREMISLDQHRAAVAGVECRVDEDVLDESPAAYKDIDAVMRAQADLVEPVAILKQVVCVKG
jgi:tRNA-splicing ligase RtcB